MFQRQLDLKANAASVEKQLSEMRATMLRQSAEHLRHNQEQRDQHEREMLELRRIFQEGRRKLLEEVERMVHGNKRLLSPQEMSGASKKKKSEDGKEVH